MKYSTISAALGLLFTRTLAAPTASSESLDARQFQVQVRFEGAPPDAAFYTLFIPADGSVVRIYNPLSISHITSLGGATCSFKGIDGSNTITIGAQTVDVGPPQTQISASCRAF